MITLVEHIKWRWLNKAINQVVCVPKMYTNEWVIEALPTSRRITKKSICLNKDEFTDVL